MKSISHTTPAVKKITVEYGELVLRMTNKSILKTLIMVQQSPKMTVFQVQEMSCNMTPWIIIHRLRNPI